MFTNTGDAIWMPFHDTIGIFHPMVFLFWPPNEIWSIFQCNPSTSQVLYFWCVGALKHHVIESKNRMKLWITCLLFNIKLWKIGFLWRIGRKEFTWSKCLCLWDLPFDLLKRLSWSSFLSAPLSLFSVLWKVSKIL